MCEHRWRQIFNMVRFRNIVQGKEKIFTYQVSYEIVLPMFLTMPLSIKQVLTFIHGGIMDLIKSPSVEEIKDSL